MGGNDKITHILKRNPGGKWGHYEKSDILDECIDSSAEVVSIFFHLSSMEQFVEFHSAEFGEESAIYVCEIYWRVCISTHP